MNRQMPLHRSLPLTSISRDLLHCLGLVLVIVTATAHANPLPDVPVHLDFAKDGRLTVRLEVDPRCFTIDPMSERYLMKVDLTHSDTAYLDGLKAKAVDAIAHWVQFVFDPPITAKPAFQVSFTGLNQAKLEKFDDPVVITAVWTFTMSEQTKSLRVKATDTTPYSIVVRFAQNGVEQKRMATLFPGEMSFGMPVRP